MTIEQPKLKSTSAYQSKLSIHTGKSAAKINNVLCI
jgi:hypothetical protein